MTVAPGVIQSLPDWRLWRRQVAAVLGLELRKTFLRLGALPVLFLAAAPVGLLAARAAVLLAAGRSDSLASETAAFANIFQAFILRLGIFFGCVGIFTQLFRGELLQRTLHFYFLAPLRREVLLVGKYLAGLLAATAIFTIATAASLFLVYLPDGAAGREYLLHGPGFAQLGAYVGVAALACAGYGAVFLLMGLLFRNPMIPAAAVLGWESINFLLPPLLKRASVVYYLQSLCPVPISEGPFAFPAAPASPLAAIGGLLALAAALLAIAAWRVRRVEVLYGQD
jgi:ABC-type transport system involved in multi-copper enzyme maturation permease subunit